MTASMGSTTIGEPFQLYLSSNLAQKHQKLEAVYTTYNRDFPGYATVTAQAEGIHIWDIQNLHAVASCSVDKHVKFAIPTFSLCVTEDGDKTIISYALLELAPGTPKEHHGRIIWIIRQKISDSTVAANKITSLIIDSPPVQICGTGHPMVPLLFVAKNGGLSFLNAQVEIKDQIDWPGERTHVETFVFPRQSCSFIQDDPDSCSSVVITCCQTRKILHVRLVLVGEEKVPVGTCEIPIASATNNGVISLTCSSSGALSFIGSSGIWATYQLRSLSSSLILTPMAESLHLRRFAIIAARKKKPREIGLSVVSLGTSLVLLATLVEETQDISLQIWDLSHGVLLTAQLIPVPSEILLPHLILTIADEGQVLLTVSPSSGTEKIVAPKRSSIHIVPVDARLRSNIAASLGKMTQTVKWLAPKKPDPQEFPGSDKTDIISCVRASLKDKNAQKAEQAFLEWIGSQSSKEAVLGHEFVKKIFRIILPEPPKKYPYTPRITRCILEDAVVSVIMFHGRFLTMLRQRGDWENLMFALTVVPDISEDELMASAKFLVDRQRRSENMMHTDASEGYIPPLWSYLFACVSYTFSAAPMRLAIRKHLPDAQDLVLVLEILENWIQGGTEHEVEDLLKSLATNTDVSLSRADSPPYPKVLLFLHTLLDASFVALLQYQPSHDLLRRLLSHVEPEIMFMNGLEPLRGMLEPFARAQKMKEKVDASEEGPAEWRRRRRQLREQASLSVGSYRLEELVF